MNKNRLKENFIEMVKIYSPSKNEGNYANYLVNLLKEMGGKIYLDNGHEKYDGNSPTIFVKFPGSIQGEGVTFSAHMDVIEPNENLKIIEEGSIIRTDGTTTLGADDKGGVAAVIEAIRSIKEENKPHRDIFAIFTPAEEIGMLGAKNIDWDKLPKDMYPAKNMIVLDNSGTAGTVAHSAPSRYFLKATFKGKKSHAGIEPEKGVNAILMAAESLSNMNMGRIDELTTSNFSSIKSDFPTNVVPDSCEFTGEIRSHSEEKILEIIKQYENCIKKATEKFGGSYKLEYVCEFPVLKPLDDLKFAKEFAKVYEDMGIESKLIVIGGGSDSNIFAQKGFNSIILAVGMNNVHTVEEYMTLEDLYTTTEALVKYIEKNV